MSVITAKKTGGDSSQLDSTSKRSPANLESLRRCPAAGAAVTSHDSSQSQTQRGLNESFED